MKKWLIIPLLLLLSACGGVSRPEVISAEAVVSTVTPIPPIAAPTVTHTVMPTQVAVLAQLDTPTPTPTVAATSTSVSVPTPTDTPPPDWLAVSGRTTDDLMFLGNPDAPVTMYDFSDFM